MLSDNTKSYLQLHLIVFIWGFTAILGKLITLQSIPLVWFRMVFAVIFIFIYMKIKKKSFSISKATAIKFLFAGCIIALHWFTFFKAIKVSNVSVTLACLATGSFFTSLLEPIFYKRKIIWYEVFFGLIVVLGLYIIFNIETKFIEGIVLGLTSAFLSAFFSVINSKLVKKHDPTLISFYELSGGVLFLSILLLISSSFTANFFNLSLHNFAYLLILSSVCTAYAFIVSTSVMKHLSAYTVMLTINLEPIYGIILALLIFNDSEKMKPEFYLGAVIILFSVIVNSIIKNKKSKS